MALDVASGQFICPLSTGVGQPISGLSFQPKGGIIWGSGCGVDDDSEDNARMFIGAFDGTRQRVTAANMQNGAGTTDTHRRWLDDEAIWLHTSGGQGVTMNASFSAFETDGVSFDFHNISANKRLQYLLFGGDHLENFEVGDFTMNTGVTEEQDISFVTAFEPDGVILINTRNATTSDTNQNDAHIGLGIADFTNEANISFSSDDGVGTSDCHSRQSNTSSIIRISDTSDTIEGEATVTQALSGGFRIDITTAYNAADRIIYVAFKGPQIHVSEPTFSTVADADIPVTGLGFTPKAILGMNQNNDVQNDGRNHSILTMGASTGVGTDTSISITSQNNVGTTNTESRNAFVFMSDSDFNNNVDGQASLKSFDSDGYTLVQSDNPSTDPVIMMNIAFGDKQTTGNSAYYQQQQILAG